MPLILALSLAHGADVVWLSPPDDATRAMVLAAAGGTEIDAITLRSAASDASAADDDALKALATALEAVRPYEQQLDGELLIMRDLQRPVERVTLLRDEADRNALFAALAYQGFAVDRFFGDELATNDDAAPYRAEHEGVVVASPWRDAVALDPERKISAYDIAEAPQRVRYGEVQALVLKQLPATLVTGELPDGAAWVVDGRVTSPDATGAIKVPPGRHLAHIAHGDHVLQRWDVTLAPGDEAPLEVSLPDAVWEAFLSDLQDGAVPPKPVQDVLAAHGEVWLARPGPKTPTVFAATPSGVRAIEIAPPGKGASERDGGGGRPGLQLGLVGGWTGSQDFYYQDPRVDPTFATVNAATVGASAGLDVPLGLLRVGAGVDIFLPLGANHAARTGSDELRIRPVPHVAAGLKQASAAVGFVFPYHPALGLRGSQGLVGPLELRWMGWFGLPTTSSRDGAADYTTRPLGVAAAGVGVRL